MTPLLRLLLVAAAVAAALAIFQRAHAQAAATCPAEGARSCQCASSLGLRVSPGRRPFNRRFLA